MTHIARIVKLLPIIFASVLFFTAIPSAQAEGNVVAAPNAMAGTQLAYYYGGHWYRHPGRYWGPGYVYYGPRYYHYYYAPHVYRTYWTGWRPYGYRCNRTCLVNQWNGGVVRCVRRCY